jgi:hypothetical protein
LDVATDHRDNPFDAASGRYQQVQLDYAGGLLGGTNEFGRIGLTWQGYRSPRRGWVLAAGWRRVLEPFSTARGSGHRRGDHAGLVWRVPWRSDSCSAAATPFVAIREPHRSERLASLGGLS